MSTVFVTLVQGLWFLLGNNEHSAPLESQQDSSNLHISRDFNQCCEAFYICWRHMLKCRMPFLSVMSTDMYREREHDQRGKH